jgi:hypothetical protein
MLAELIRLEKEERILIAKRAMANRVLPSSKAEIQDPFPD